MSITRRDALKGIGALAGATAASRLLTGCETRPGEIDTIVYLMMENRTYDHFLGSRSLLEGKPGDGLRAEFANPDKDGNLVGITPVTNDLQCAVDPPHSWDPSRIQWNNGQNDGFAKAFQASHPGLSGVTPMTYLRRADLPVTSALADAYTTCDRWFASLLGPTLPNRMYWMAASSYGFRSNPEVISSGLAGVHSIFHNMSNAGVDWAYYYNDIAVVSAVQDLDITGKVRRFLPDFLDDAQAGRLPAVTYIDPGFTYNDYHPPHHPLLAEQLISAVYTALSTSPQWGRSLLLITFDEHGGFFDHVSPGKAADERAADGFDQLGFRVPAFVIGPWAKKSYVSSVPRDHTSALKHLANVHHLPALTLRDAAATDLSECIDFARMETGEVPAPIQLPAVEIDEASLPDSCRAGSDIVRGYGHDVVEWADAMRHTRVGDFDRRAFARDDIYALGNYLDRHNLGRIRRGR